MVKLQTYNLDNIQEFCLIFRNTYFKEHLSVLASQACHFHYRQKFKDFKQFRKKYILNKADWEKTLNPYFSNVTLLYFPRLSEKLLDLKGYNNVSLGRDGLQANYI